MYSLVLTPEEHQSEFDQLGPIVFSLTRTNEGSLLVDLTPKYFVVHHLPKELKMETYYDVSREPQSPKDQVKATSIESEGCCVIPQTKVPMYSIQVSE